MNKDKKEITGIDLVNFKKVSEILTGKQFNLRSDRGFGKYSDDVNRLVSSLDNWIDSVNGIEVVDAVIEKPVIEKPQNTFTEAPKKEVKKKEVDMDSLRAIGFGIKPFKCGCWIDEKNQLRRPKGSNCNLFKSEHK